jgi:hypothetical protein
VQQKEKCTKSKYKEFSAFQFSFHLAPCRIFRQDKKIALVVTIGSLQT